MMVKKQASKTKASTELRKGFTGGSVNIEHVVDNLPAVWLCRIAWNAVVCTVQVGGEEAAVSRRFDWQLTASSVTACVGRWRLVVAFICWRTSCAHLVHLQLFYITHWWFYCQIFCCHKRTHTYAHTCGRVFMSISNSCVDCSCLV